jgi:1,4-dihydroxy-2-naphthoyl-CoA hydrolase
VTPSGGDTMIRKNCFRGVAWGRASCIEALDTGPLRHHIRPIGTAPLNADDTADAARLQMIAEMQPPFSRLMGTKIVDATRDRVVAEVLVREELTNRNGGLHGGAVMAIADNLGGTATFLNMPEGAGTTTIESKTNFFAAVPLGDTVRAECTPLHRGRTTMVWQTRIIRSDGKLAAIVTQTQLITRKDGCTPS